MDPVTISLLTFLVQEAIKYEPTIAAAIKDLLTKAAPTDADFAALREHIAQQTYRKMVPNTRLSVDIAP